MIQTGTAEPLGQCHRGGGVIDDLVPKVASFVITFCMYQFRMCFAVWMTLSEWQMTLLKCIIWHYV